MRNPDFCPIGDGRSNRDTRDVDPCNCSVSSGSTVDLGEMGVGRVNRFGPITVFALVRSGIDVREGEEGEETIFEGIVAGLFKPNVRLIRDPISGLLDVLGAVAVGISLPLLLSPVGRGRPNTLGRS
jgi:hypothetical protein